MNKRRPESAKWGTIYFIQHTSGSYKIGITLDWTRRSKELRIGTDCKQIIVRQIKNPGRLEKVLLRKYSSYNLPGSEWLNLGSNHVESIKDSIKESSKGYKQIFDSRKKHMIDLEIALQDDPELLEKVSNTYKEIRIDRAKKEEERIKKLNEPPGIGYKIFSRFAMGIFIFGLITPLIFLGALMWPLSIFVVIFVGIYFLYEKKK